MTALGYQASSLKAYLTTPNDVQDTFQKLQSIGYRDLQIQWINPEVPDEAVADALKSTQLNCIATQDYFSVVVENLQRFLHMNVLWGSRYLTVSRIPKENMSLDGLRAFSYELRKLLDAVQDKGLRLAFHPIWSDYALVQGKPAVDWLMDFLPQDVQLTLCVYHAEKAGLNSVTVLKRYSGRCDLVHFKDSVVLPDGGETLMPIGQGHIKWEDVFRACHETGVKWGFVEQERWHKDAFVCAKESFDFVTSLGIVSR